MSEPVDELERRFTDAATTSAWRSAQDSANELRDIARDAIALAKRQREALREKPTGRWHADCQLLMIQGCECRIVASHPENQRVVDAALQGQGADDGKTQ